MKRAHRQAIASCRTNSTICESVARSVLIHPPPQEPQKDKAAEIASLTAHQQATLKIVAQHMIQKVDTVTANHEHVTRLLKDQLAGLGNSSMDDTGSRRAIENEIKELEQAHNELLKSLEEKVRQDSCVRATWTL